MADKKGRPPSATPFAEVFSDRPVTTAEGLAFEFEGLAKTLAELVWNPHNGTPFTVVVRGDWGRGKTTLMRQVQRLLGEQQPQGARTVRSIWFNAWKYPNDETVLAGLLGALLDELRTGDVIEQLKVEVNNRKDGLAKTLLKIAAPWLDLGATDDRYTPSEEKRAFYDSFRRLFGQVWYLWQANTAAALRDMDHLRIEERLRERQGEHVLAVFLDDLDRCPEDRVLEVMEAINLFLDLPGVCFYLGLDWKRLVELLEKKMPGREDAFLEKIVQVSLDLPAVSERGVLDYARTLVKKSTLAAVLSDGGENSDLAALAAAMKSNHPRHVKRVLNDLSMAIAVMRNAGPIGEADGQLPDHAVVAWHLLHEVLPAPEWEELRALPVNVEAFIRRWQALGSATEDNKRPDEVSDDVLRVHERGFLARHMLGLAALSGRQLDVLVNLGSPPREERKRGGRVRGFDLEKPDSSSWIALSGGTFQMGEDFDDARVTLSPFLMSRFPVTNAQYGRFVTATGKAAPEPWQDGTIPEGKENHPVADVSWTDAAAFCVWLRKQLGADDNRLVRLPTEAEWEYAARGEEGRTYPWGDDEPTSERANFGKPDGGTTPVGSFPSGVTPDGIHDLAGNVWEWCADWYGAHPDKALTDPKGPDDGEARVLRGGAFSSRAGHLRTVARRYARPERRSPGMGFRVVCSLPGGQD